MKKFFAILLSATVLAAPMAQAQDWRHGPDRSRHVEKRVDKRVHVQKKVVVHKHRWVKGHRMSPAERRRMAEIRDYRRYRLSAPPRGYHWVKVDNDFLLVGIATGVISSIIASR
ncbi:RcnB family protein [Neorhizobium sp. CSC1952]|uniref:Regulator RcnB of Ni and Co efflux n=1 Tax=Xaviernesmea oryzae TaxID=464029 RepID=A0A1X7GHU7_9HYPH|nr:MULTISPECIES: RcnB family protein [Rhizobium/Agrobacterium group]WJR66508.1 RcnB family protein [Rhizobium sp. CSC1952]SMF70016.1 regulator RcnB of Ni and Co efflux [Xaviernesmea oryzae]